MEFKEIYTSPFTTPTTCYSCGRKKSNSIKFATENHILGVDISTTNNADNNDYDNTGKKNAGGGNAVVKTICSSVPRNCAHLVCVGYTYWEEKKKKKEEEKENKDIQAMVFIDPTLIEENLSLDHDLSSSNMNLHRPYPVTIDKDDAVSVMSMSNTEGPTQSQHHRQQQQQQQQHYRRQNQLHHNRNPSTASATPSVSSNISGSFVGSYNRKGSHTAVNNDTNDNNKNDEEKKNKKSKARLVLRQCRYSQSFCSDKNDICEEDENDIDQEKQQQKHHYSSSASLDFRPLCPCVARWRKEAPSRINEEAGNEANTEIVGVWLGSADDATLRFYVPSSDDPYSLLSVALPEEHFSVDSPVMALDFCTVNWQDAKREQINKNNKNDIIKENKNDKEKIENSLVTAVTRTTTKHTLACACQDGTIQLITFQSQQDDLFFDVTSKKIVVDGPLVCLKLDYNRYTSLRVIVGSLCGYVCQLTYDHDYNNHNDGHHCSSWEGPFMIAQDLWNPMTNTEESVLVVDVYKNYIVIGTQLGRCVLYATYDSEKYFLVWQVMLPYSVHGITIINSKNATNKTGNTSSDSDKEETCSISLAVTTRRSFHLFEAVRGSIIWRRKPARKRYSADLGRGCLLQILQEIRNENEKSDFIAKLVRETIEDLIEQVEEKFHLHHDNNIENSSNSRVEETIDASVVISGTITNLLDRVEQIAHENTLIRSTSPDPGLSEIVVNAVPDTPQWEYSSSDDDDVDDNPTRDLILTTKVPLVEPRKTNTRDDDDNEEIRNLTTRTKQDESYDAMHQRRES